MEKKKKSKTAVKAGKLNARRHTGLLRFPEQKNPQIEETGTCEPGEEACAKAGRTETKKIRKVNASSQHSWGEADLWPVPVK